MPYVIWELVGFSWGGKYEKYKPGDLKSYLKWAKAPTSWENPNGIGWSGVIGLDAALDSKRGAKYGMETIGRHIFEYVRMDERVCGFAPWFQCGDLLPATIWTQPVYCGLRGDGSLPLRNIFAGRDYRQDAFVVNDSSETCHDALLRVSLAEFDGGESILAEWPIGELKAGKRAASDVNLKIPAAKNGRWAQVRLRILADGKELSRNFYDVFIQNFELAMAPLDANGVVGVLSCKSTGSNRLNEILETLRMKHVEVSTPEALKTCRLLIIPPSARKPEIDAPMTQEILEWVKSGGSLLTLEQSWSGEFPLISKKLNPTATIFADLVIPSHPAFKGLSQANFEFWSNPDFGQTGGYGHIPLGDDLVAAKGPVCSKKETFALLTDGKLGKGRMLSSQFDACALWGSDSAATTYMRNLLSAALLAPQAMAAK